MKKLILLFLLATSACAASNPQADPVVLTSTTILADITSRIAGGRLAVESLLPPGVDPHSYQPVPQDAARIMDSRVLIVNGADYEAFLESLIESAAGDATIIEASRGLSLKDGVGNGVDPHVWLDPNNVIAYVENIRDGMIEFDPGGESVYESNAQAYVGELQALDDWIREQVGGIPPERRLLVTNHEALAYFSERYGFTIIGAVVPGVSSVAAPSAGGMAALIDLIRSSGAQAIFLDEVENPALAQQIADETGIVVVSDLHLESLTDGPPAGTYMEMMKHNVSRIVDALK